MASVSTTFNSNLGGWTMVGDPASFQWQSTGRNPGGFAQWTDQASGQDCYYVAPTRFTGDKSAFYGGRISYDIEDTGNNASGVPDIELHGHGLTLVYVAGQPGTDWTHFSAKLRAAAGWYVGSHDATVSGDQAATEAQMKAVLRHLQSVEIRAEYQDGDETGGLDNVTLTTAATRGQAPAAQASPAATRSDLAESLFDAAFGSPSYAGRAEASASHPQASPQLAADHGHGAFWGVLHGRA